MNIKNILLIIIFIYVIYLHSKINNIKNMEKFAVTDDIRAIVKEIYNTDMEAVRQLAKMAEDLRAGGIKILGNLIVEGNITNTGAIKSTGNILSTGNIISNGEIKSTGDIISNGEIKTLDKNNTEKISLNTSITRINSSLSSINATMPVFVHFVANGNTNNYNHHCWSFTSDSEVFLTWSQSIIVRNNLVARARALGYALPEARVKTTPHGWDFRSTAWCNFVINVPAGKACRIFGWLAQNNNDTYYGPGVHHVSSLNLSPNGFHGIWAGLESIKYDLIPQGYSMSSFNY